MKARLSKDAEFPVSIEGRALPLQIGSRRHARKANRLAAARLGRRGWPVATPSPGHCGVVLFALQTLAEAIGLCATELHDMRLVGQAVEQGGREALVAKDLGPVGEAHVGGDDQGDPLT